MTIQSTAAQTAPFMAALSASVGLSEDPDSGPRQPRRVAAVARAVRLVKRLPASAKAFPIRMDVLAQVAGVSLGSVVDAVGELAARGELDVVPGAAGELPLVAPVTARAATPGGPASAEAEEPALPAGYGAAVLEFLALHPGATTDEVAKGLQQSRGPTYRLLKTLEVYRVVARPFGERSGWHRHADAEHLVEGAREVARSKRRAPSSPSRDEEELVPAAPAPADPIPAAPSPQGESSPAPAPVPPPPPPAPPVPAPSATVEPPAPPLTPAIASPAPARSTRPDVTVEGYLQRWWGEIDPEAFERTPEEWPVQDPSEDPWDRYLCMTQDGETVPRPAGTPPWMPREGHEPYHQRTPDAAVMDLPEDFRAHLLPFGETPAQWCGLLMDSLPGEPVTRRAPNFAQVPFCHRGAYHRSWAAYDFLAAGVRKALRDAGHPVSTGAVLSPDEVARFDGELGGPGHELFFPDVLPQFRGVEVEVTLAVHAAATQYAWWLPWQLRPAVGGAWHGHAARLLAWCLRLDEGMAARFRAGVPVGVGGPDRWFRALSTSCWRAAAPELGRYGFSVTVVDGVARVDSVSAPALSREEMITGAQESVFQLHAAQSFAAAVMDHMDEEAVRYMASYLRIMRAGLRDDPALAEVVLAGQRRMGLIPR